MIWLCVMQGYEYAEILSVSIGGPLSLLFLFNDFMNLAKHITRQRLNELHGME